MENKIQTISITRENNKDKFYYNANLNFIYDTSIQLLATVYKAIKENRPEIYERFWEIVKKNTNDSLKDLENEKNT